jgi:RHS repeat-associated protein
VIRIRSKLAVLIVFRKFGVAVLCVVILALLSGSAFGQASPLEEEGIKPYGAYSGGDIDKVSLTNGTLDVRIPIVSYPQRGGKLKFSFSLHYTPGEFTITEICVPKTKCEFYAGGGGVSPTMSWDQSLAQGATYTSEGHLSYWSVSDAYGAIHTLGNTTGSLWESLDATGIQYNATSGIITDSSGVQYNDQLSSPAETLTVQDPNGNEISTTASGPWTDSLGRVVPNSTGVSTTNYAGCAGTLTVTSAVTWTVPGLNGSSQTYKFCYADTTFSYTLQSGNFQYKGGGTRSVLQSVLLPNGASWIFGYETNYGALASITEPTGGTISYTYQIYQPPCVQTGTSPIPFLLEVMSRSVNANDGSGAHTWNYSWGSPVDITDPMGNDTLHTITALAGSCSYYETQTQYYQGSSSSGTLLKTVATTYNYAHNPDSLSPILLEMNVVPTSITTTWALDDAVSNVAMTYDSGFSFTGGYGTGTGIYGNVVTKSEYDYGIGTGTWGPLLRKTLTTYEVPGDSSYVANNLVRLPASRSVQNGSGVQQALTMYAYDEYAVSTSGVTNQHNTSPPDNPYRGNQTSVHKWQNGSAVATPNCAISVSNGYLTNYTAYYDTGMPYYSTDSCGSQIGDSKHTTDFAYSSAYFGAYLTGVLNPLNQQTTSTYDLNLGSLLTTTDPNNQSTTFTYDASTGRQIEAQYPDGGQTNFCYTDIPGYSCSNSTPPFGVIVTRKITSAITETQTAYVDGLGRYSQSQLNSDPSGVDYVYILYDADGRKYYVSNPYRSTSDSSYGITYYIYDALGRTTKVTQPDGSIVTTAYCGNTTLVTDESGHWRRSTTDGLGRIAEVDEPNSTTAQVNSNACPGTGDPIWATTYGYDALDDLTSVTQGGSRSRSFAYDSLKQLTSASNPESGSFAYKYDADGNVVTKLDSRPVTTTYAYDVLNRMIGKTYSNGDPPVTFTWDQVQSGYYNVGRRTSMSDGAGSESINYDPMGREWKEQRITNGVTENTTYTYNLDGSTWTLTYPSGRVITYSYNAAAQPLSAVDTTNNISYAINAYYAPDGSLAQLQNGTNVITTHIYNDRFQPCWVFATTGSALAWQPTQTSCTSTASPAGNILDLKYNFNLSHDNGNLIGITNNRDNTRSQSFTYDQVNRIVTAETSATSGANCWGESYSYDQWANLTNIGAVSGYTGCTQENLSVTATTNNQLSATGFSYDAAGNMLTDSSNTYGYNAESEIKSAAGVNYTYDGDGNRMEKSSGKIYWYGAGTAILDESTSSGSITDEYVFFGKMRIAHRDVNNNIYYYAQDKLGSTRTLVEAGQTSPCYDADYYPYGGERDVVTTCSQNYKFEGKERDTETGNDDFDARYYSSRIGRWLSADWSAVPAPVPYADLANPQTLNLYAMVKDNPETFADLDGHLGGAGEPSVEPNEFLGFCGTTENGSCGESEQNFDPSSLWHDGSAICYACAPGPQEPSSSGSQSTSSGDQNGSSGQGLWDTFKHGVINITHGHSWSYVEPHGPMDVATWAATDEKSEGSSTVAIGTDVLGYTAEAAKHAGHMKIGTTGTVVGSLISLKNDPTPQNALMIGLSFVPVLGEGVAAVGMVMDVAKPIAETFTDKVLAPMANAAPPQTMDNGTGQTVKNPGLMTETDLFQNH